MINLMVKHTNEEGERDWNAWNEQHPDEQMQYKATDAMELWAMIGLMFLRGIYAGYREPLTEMWNPQTGREVFIETMSRARFQTMLKLLRFDDRATREVRGRADNFAPIRELFDKFNDACRDNYTLSPNVTIDETLRKFRGRCKFRVYMPAKPGKYGMLFRVLTDEH